LEHYAKAFAAEEQRQDRVKEKICRLLDEATPRHHDSRTEQCIGQLEEMLEAVLGLLRRLNGKIY